MKILFPSVEELIEELKERDITEVRLITTDKSDSIKYGRQDEEYSVLHHTLETVVTANMNGLLAEARIRYGRAACAPRSAEMEWRNEVE
jgi:hypothetical protein